MRARHENGESLAIAEVVLFFAGITAPLLGAVTGLSPTAVEPEKELDLDESLPPPSRGARDDEPLSLTFITERITEFPRTFESYFNYHFGYRNSLIRFHNRLKAIGLGIAPTDDVVVGSDGWMFYAGQKGIEQYRASEPFGPEMLDVWFSRLAKVDEWLADRGIEYVVFIAPAKPTIYSEFLPSHVRRLRSEGRLDELLTTLAHSSEVDIIDARPEFMAAKVRFQLYGKTDTHWTAAGAFVGYEVLARRLKRRFPAIDVLEESDFEIRISEGAGGDIARLIRLRDAVREPLLELVPRESRSFEWVKEGLVPMTMPALLGDSDDELASRRRQAIATERDVDGYPRIVMFHDSFASSLIPYLGHSVRRGVYYWQRNVDPEIIDFERPDIVIQEIGERVLMRRARVLPDESILIDFDRRREFRASAEVLFTLQDAGDWSIEPRGGANAELISVLEIEVPSATRTPLLLRLDVEFTTPTEVVFERGASEMTRRLLRVRREIVYVRYPVLESGETIRVRTSDPDRRFIVRALEMRGVRSDR